MATASTLTLEPYGPVDALAPADIAAAVAIFNAAWAAWVPGERPMTAAAFADVARLSHAPTVEHRVLARDAAGALVAFGWVAYRGNDPVPAACAIDLFVAPAVRRTGVGRALGAHLVEVARDAGRIGATFVAAVDSGADAGCRATGLREDLITELNRADTAYVDDALLADWIAAGEAASGYSLFTFDGRCPDPLLPSITLARHAMNDAPRYEGEPEAEYTEDEVRCAEVAIAAANHDWWGVGVRHDPSGDVVGLTDLFLPTARPWIAFQGDTAVVPAHRGHALGAWMKATNHLRLRQERPDVGVVSTWNAAANAPMLRINRALGFEPAQRFRAWYLPFD